MISLALAAAFLLPKAPQSVILSRGTSAAGIPIWDVEDTTLDAKAPNQSLGGGLTLEGGPLKTILIRFGDIDRVVQPGWRVTKARLVMTTEGGNKGKLRSISQVLAPWGEGPYPTMSGIIFKPRPAADAKAVEPTAPALSSTWRQRRAGDPGIAWEQPGAEGNRDVTPISSARFTSNEAETQITGLENAVQAMADDPYGNHGFAIQFDNATAFSSSESDRNRPRLELELQEGAANRGPDLSVVSIERLGADGKLPADGAPTTYTAHIKNVGDAGAKPFAATWTIDEREGTAQDVAKALEAGQETTLTYQLPYHPDKGDHRLHTVMLRIHPTGPDASARNDALSVFTDGKPIEVVVDSGSVAKLAASATPEDWVQNQVRTFNDVYLAQSRFSFAPDGARERLSVQRVVIGTTHEGAPSDGSVRISLDPGGSEGGAVDSSTMKALGIAIGLQDRSASNIAPGQNNLDGRGGEDRYKGVMGYGDTRFDGLAPGEIELPYEPYFSPIYDTIPLEPTGLLCSTDVAMLNTALGDGPLALPHAVLLRTLNQANLPIANVQLDFFQTKGGQIAKGATPDFSVTADARGTVILPDRPGGLYGTLEPNYSNGVFLVRGTANGVSDSAWLKAWQAIDCVSRGNRAARAVAVMDLHFCLPSDPLEPDTNLAADRIVTDSTGALPAKLSTLIDGSNETTATLGATKGDWVEIDLGRDRTIGEVDLIAPANEPFWQKFDLMAYITGQKPDEAVIWSREVDWAWTSRNHFEPAGANRVMVRYRGSALRFRYLRILNRAGGAGSLAEIRIIAAKVTQ